MRTEIKKKEQTNLNHQIASKGESGITLIALVVTIVILLILAGITISLVFSENGIIAKAREAAEKTNQAAINEQAHMNELAEYLENALNEMGENGEEPNPPKPTLPSDGSYSEEKGVNTPNLGEGMTAIKWDKTKNDWVETDGSDQEWYDYTAKKWANAKTSDGSMWVWIPRYAYSITSGYHSSSAGNIEVEFMKGLTNETSTGRTSFNNASGQGNWNIHPAFNYGQQVSGIWVAKFEASNNGGEIKIQPGVSSWRVITVNDIYTNCLNYNKTLNSHMMKNDEWGAVAYLSRSKYGKNAELTINDNSSYYTGGGSGNAYVTNVGQSTTGTVHGVYDMSGGAWEYVAAYVNNGNGNLTTYGSSLLKGDAKTKNVYTPAKTDNNMNNYNQNLGKYGDAVYETSISGSESTSWYGDYSLFPSLEWPFFERGGGYDFSTISGAFNFSDDAGISYGANSFRPVLAVI